MGFGYTFAFFFFFQRVCTVTSHGFIVQETKCTVHGSHDTIHMLKNYFVTAFSIFNF